MPEISESSEIRDHCSLGEAEHVERRALVRREILPSVSRTIARPGGFDWELRDTPEARERARHFVELESHCCTGELRFGLAEAPLRIEIRGVEPGSSLHATLSAAAGRGSQDGAIPLLGSAGLGVVASALAFCVLPLGLAAVAGASLAGWAGGLDDPWVIGAGALGFGLAIEVWRRRSRRPTRG